MAQQLAGGSISRSTMLQVVGVHTAVAVDVLVSAFADDPALASQELLAHMLLLSLQVFLLLAIVLSFFLLSTSVSVYARLGLFNVFLRRHRAVFCAALGALLLLAGCGGYRLALAYRGQTTPMDVWRQPGFTPLWAAQRLALLLLQCTTAYAVAAAFKDAGAGADGTLVPHARRPSCAPSRHAPLLLQPGPLV